MSATTIIEGVSVPDWITVEENDEFGVKPFRHRWNVRGIAKFNGVPRGLGGMACDPDGLRLSIRLMAELVKKHNAEPMTHDEWLAGKEPKKGDAGKISLTQPATPQ